MEELNLIKDFPIKLKNEDCLGRAKFASDLAKAIQGYVLEECLTIGIFGEWGSGKSSLINLIKEQLKNENAIKKVGNEKKFKNAIKQLENKKKLVKNKYKIEKVEKEITQLKSKNKIVIGDFEPWLIGNLESLIPECLSLIENVIKKDNESDSDAGNKIREYKKSFVAKHFKNMASGISFNLLGMINIDGGKILEKYDKSLSEYKEDVIESLKKYDKKIVVFVDDIDRLSNEEIKSVFKLIKSVADFPNVIYVLSFDRDIVASALENVQGCYGDKYMQKIIQVSYTIPKANKWQINVLFLEEFNKILKSVPEEYFDRNYFDRVYKSGLENYITNIRDVKRIINTFRLKYYAIGKECSITDLLAITILEMFEPKVFEILWDCKDFIFLLNLDSVKDRKKETINKLYNDENKSTLQPLLETILPVLKDSRGSEAYYPYRLCNRESFEKYFVLLLNQNEIPRFEVKRILELTTAEDIFIELGKLNQEDLLENFLKQGCYYIKSVEKQDTVINKENILNALSLLKFSGSASLELRNFLFSLISSDEKNIDDVITNSIGDLKNSLYIIGEITRRFYYDKSINFNLLKLKAAFLKRIQLESSEASFLDADEIEEYFGKWKLIDETSFFKYMKKVNDKKEFFKKAIFFVEYCKQVLNAEQIDLSTGFRVNLGEMHDLYDVKSCEEDILTYLEEFDDKKKNKIIALKLAFDKDSSSETSNRYITISPEDVKNEIIRLSETKSN